MFNYWHTLHEEITPLVFILVKKESSNQGHIWDYSQVLNLVIEWIMGRQEEIVHSFDSRCLSSVYNRAT